MARSGRGVWAKITIVALLPLLAVVFPLVAASLVTAQQTAERTAVRNAQRVTEQAQQVLSLLGEAETGVRRYAATGDPRFLGPEQRARRLLPSKVESLAALVGTDDPASAERLDAIRSGARAELTLLARIRGQAETAGRLPDAEVAGATREGQAVMDALRADIGAVIDVARASGEERTKTADRYYLLAHTVTYTASLGALLLCLLLSVRLGTVERSTARERLQASATALVESERKRRRHLASVSSAGTGIAIIGAADGTCTAINPAAAGLLGYAPEELTGRALHEIAHHKYPDGRPYPRRECPIRRTALDGETRRVDDEVFWRKDGTRLAVEYTCAPVYEDNTVVGVVLTFDAARRTLDEQAEQQAQHLRTAITERQLVLHYQPKVELATDRVVGVEALVRWHHPERGLLHPDEFVGNAEQHGVMPELTEFVLDEAARQHAEWRMAGADLPVAVNLSTGSLMDRDLPDQLLLTCRRHRIPTTAIEIEITETSALTDPITALDVVEMLSGSGFRIALDDFGTGFSSLSYLRDLPASVVKIDKSFVLNLAMCASDAEMVRGTIGLAHGLGKQVVAEGVETREARDLLSLMGCDYGQGYFWSPALPPTQLLAWVEHRAAAVVQGQPTRAVIDRSRRRLDA